MKNIYTILLLTLFSCNSTPKDKPLEYCHDSGFTQKIEYLSFADVDKIKSMHGKFIEIEGILHYFFEDVSIYAYGAPKTERPALWLDYFNIPDSLFKKFSLKPVRIIGRVDTAHKGHLGAYIATLDSTFCIKEI